MRRLTRFLSWLDNNIVSLLGGFLLLFIPLYPKLPLADIIPGYIVRVRLEDLFIAATAGFYLIWLIRRKIKFELSPVSIGLCVYLFFGLLSVFVSLFVTQTVPLEYLHAGKTILHWARRVEYFSLFFIIFGSIKTLDNSRAYLKIFFATLALVTLYGYGQKYLYWPAFSTMNREFSKGWMLYLTEHSRVLSTFGGHYDLAGYLVIALSLGWSFFFGAKSKAGKILYGILIAGGFWLLILTASRISFVSYLVGLVIVVFAWTFKRGLGWGLSRGFLAVFLSIIIMLSFGDLSDRFLRLLKLSDRVSGLKQILLKPTAPPPSSNAVFLVNNSVSMSSVASRSDSPPTPIRPGDVTGEEQPLLIASKSATGQNILVPIQRSYSQNALMFDLSTSIRLDATWPQAWKGFLSNPITGKGYATLTKTTREEFTEAESTDNDYLRSLGETGLLGFVSFFGTAALMLFVAWKALGGISDPFLYSLTTGFIGFAVGILVNASYIDIFEASKVAYVFWGVSGVSLGSIFISREKIKANWKPLKIEFPIKRWSMSSWNFLKSDRFLISALLIFSFWFRTYKLDSPIADWHSWRQADTSAVTREFLRNDRINWLYPTYDDLSSLASGKPNPNGFRFVEFPVYNAMTVLVKKIAPELSVEATGRITTDFSFSLSALFLFLIMRQIYSRRIAYLTAISYILIPYTMFYGRSILPDPTMVAFALGADWFILAYLASSKVKHLLVSCLLAVLAFLVKPYAIFLLLPIIYFWFSQYRFNLRKWFFMAVYFSVAFLPLVLWRVWMQRFPEGVPANDWLLNGDGIRFKGAFWFWLFADRIGRLILGYWGLIPMGIGILAIRKKKLWLTPLVFVAGAVLYLTVFATGNVRHDYYQILIIPTLAILLGLGFDFLLFPPMESVVNKTTSRILGLVCFVFMVGFGWYFVRDLFNINHPEIVEAGKAVQELTHDKSLVIAPYDGDTAFLYQTNRRGWPIIDGSIDEMVKNGAQYYVSVRRDPVTMKLLVDAEDWKLAIQAEKKTLKKYNIIKQTDTYVILQLVPNNKLPK